MTNKLRVADVFRAGWDNYNQTKLLPPHVVRTVEAILSCRTSDLGGHLYVCDQCGAEVPVYNSCKNRNCPTCQSIERNHWLNKRLAELLPVQYFHVVFTLPHELNDMINCNRNLLLNEFFQSVNWVLQSFAQDPQWRLCGQLGYISMLHTWTQKLEQHYHIHCLIPGGVWRAETGEFIECRSGWLFGKASLTKAFQNHYIQRLNWLRKADKLSYSSVCSSLKDEADWKDMTQILQKKKWIVYPKAVPANPEKALEYLARYTHRIAIADYRIKQISDGKVVYTWRDRSDSNTEKQDSITVDEFIRRFLQHMLMPGFKKIRFYGWMSNASRSTMLPNIRKALNVPIPKKTPQETVAERVLRLTGKDITRCPFCKQGSLILQQQDNYHIRDP